MPILPALAPGPMPNAAAALLHIQMGRNVASLQNGDKRLAPSCSTAIKVSKYGRIVDLLICYFTRFGDADVAGLSEKKWQMNTCVPIGSQNAPQMMKRSENGRRSQEKRVRYKWLDFSIWQINRKGDIPFEVGWAKVSTHCMANVSPGPDPGLSTSPKIWTEMTDSTIKW